jgi:RHS repeat-associated protein
MKFSTNPVSYLLAFVAVIGTGGSAFAQDGIQRNVHGTCQYNEKVTYRTVVIVWAGLTPGMVYEIRNAANAAISGAFNTGNGSGSVNQGVIETVAASNLHTYGVTFQYDRIATHVSNSTNTPATGGRVFTTLNTNNMPGAGPGFCPPPPMQQVHETVTYTVGTPSPPAPPGPHLTENDATVGGKCDKDSVGMARYTVHAMLVSLNVQDTPLRYTPARGPAIGFKVSYNQRETQQPTSFDYANLGPKWTFNWLSYVTDDPVTQASSSAVYLPGGGAETYSYNFSTQSFAPHTQSHAILVRTGSNSYERRLPDGSKQVFNLVDGATSHPRRVFMTQVIDPAGDVINLGYDSLRRLTTITDPLQQVTNVSYELIGDPLKITRVTDPFGRFATFQYTNGQLTTITDQIGIQSHFDYASGTDSMSTLTTPYGTTTFASGENGTNRWIDITDPLGGKERVEYRDQAPGISSSDPSNTVPAGTGFINAELHLRNTFYWSKKTLSVHPPVNGVYDYTKAKITHWLLSADGSTTSGIPASEKMPLENRVWYTYLGQPTYVRAGPSARPSQIARVLGTGATQLSQFEYNTAGHVTKATDPIGRVTSRVYASNNVDLLTIYQRNPQGVSTDPGGAAADKLASNTYNAQHQPLTITDAAGQTTTYVYNSTGQVETITNAKNEVTTYVYGGTVPAGHLASITSPPFNGVSAVTAFTYDSLRRVRTTTDSDNYVLTYDYDDLDRKIKVTYPDSTFEEFKYTDNVTGAMTLDITGTRDRRGLWTYRHYNANGQMDAVTDPLNRTTLYDWCSCGSLESVTDAKNQTTTFNRDIQGRVYQKVFADNTAINYLYEGQTAPNTPGATSRLKSSTDAKNQRTNYLYFADDAVQQISYTNTAGQALNPATPTVSFTYDARHPRRATMVDGTGTTTYGYYPITNPPAPGAARLQTVDGPLLNDTITHTYDELGRELSASINGVSASQSFDSLGRVGSMSNPLGLFSHGYVGVTGRLQSVAFPNGQSTVYSYYPNSGDKRLQAIQHTAPGATQISKFDYEYDSEGQISKLTKQFGPNGYPITWSNGANSMYDAADQLKTVVAQTAPDVYAQYSYDYDAAGNRSSDNGGGYTLNNVNQITDSGYTYDLNGNLTADPGRTFTWDAANRLIAIDYPAIGSRSEFTYDGLNRRVKMVEKNPGLSVVLQPPNTQYSAYSGTAVFSAGTYTLKLEGLNPNGGDNTAFVDAVTLNGTLVSNGSFELPATGSYVYRPSGGTWGFVGDAGVSANGTAFTGGNPNTSDGLQVGFIQKTGNATQAVSLGSGSYTLGLKAAQRGNGNQSYQRVRVSLESAVPIASTKQFVWNGLAILEERDGSNAVKRRYYAQGEQRVGGSDAGLYYYTKDQLGSIRELTDSTGAVRARYDYDPYGYTTKLSGDLEVDFGYTGHYRHAASDLYLAPYRAYDPTVGRWMSRDPLKDAELTQGPNLYGYVRNNPTNWMDLLGLQDSAPTPRPGPHPTPFPPTSPHGGGLSLSDAGRALLGGLGVVVPGSELLDVAAMGPNIGKIAILLAFEKACRDCFIKACTDSPELRCDVCNDYQRLVEAFKS